MKYCICEDEYWPVYALETEEEAFQSYCIVETKDLPPNFPTRYKEAVAEWQACQDILKSLYGRKYD